MTSIKTLHPAVPIKIVDDPRRILVQVLLGLLTSWGMITRDLGQSPAAFRAFAVFTTLFPTTGKPKWQICYCEASRLTECLSWTTFQVGLDFSLVVLTL